MNIGIDFDNTIVSYDALFHQIALEKKIIPSSLHISKSAVRDHLRAIKREDLWTLLQGEVYGLRMSEAPAYPGFFEFLKKAQECGHEVSIISHKTKYPFVGPKYDLHQAAKNWIKNATSLNNLRLNQNTNTFFEITKEEKIARIAELNCHLFIDDLPEILSMSGFPDNIQKILFDPYSLYLKTHPEYSNARSWKYIESHFI